MHQRSLSREEWHAHWQRIRAGGGRQSALTGFDTVAHPDGGYSLRWRMTLTTVDGHTEEWEYDGSKPDGPYFLVSSSTASSTPEGDTVSAEVGQRVRKRITIDLILDPGSAGDRVMKQISNEMKEYSEVVLCKDREVALVDFDSNLVVDVHDHVSRPGEACRVCVERLAMDERA